jgi:hypothetical protein
MIGFFKCKTTNITAANAKTAVKTGTTKAGEYFVVGSGDIVNTVPVGAQ